MFEEVADSERERHAEIRQRLDEDLDPSACDFLIRRAAITSSPL
jgi:hypothetical protein